MGAWQRSRPRRQPGGSGWNWGRIRVAVLERDLGMCRWCGGVATVVDHVVPVARGGTDDLANLVAACETCNERRRREQARAGRPAPRRRESERHPGEVR